MFKWIFVFLMLASFVSAHADERMGEISLGEIMLSPKMHLNEPSEGGFRLDESYFSVNWQKDENLSAQIRLGTSDIRLPAFWYTPPTSSKTELTLVELWGQFITESGDIKWGLLPVPIGYESYVSEGNWLLPQSEMRLAHLFSLNDYGFQYSSHTGPFVTTLTIHNGEGGEDKDNKTWYSGLWGIVGRSGTGFLASGSTGNLKPTSTNGGGNTLSSFDPTHEAKVREGVLTLFHRERYNYYLVEMLRGEFLQDDLKKGFASGRAEVALYVSDPVRFLLRYEELQYNLDADSKQKTTGVGFRYESSDKLYSLTLFGKKHQETPEVQNDELDLTLRLTNTLF